MKMNFIKIVNDSFKQKELYRNVERRETMEKRKADILNVLRTVALLMVFLLHGRENVAGITEASGPLAILTWLPAWGGGWVLFFISSFLLGMNFLSEKYELITDNKINFRGLWTFYRRRFLRIAPLYYFYCFIYAFLSGDQYLVTSGWTTLRILTFTYNGDSGPGVIHHLWYISTAMQMYLLIPFVYLLVRRFRSLIGSLISFFSCLLFGFCIRFLLNRCGVTWVTWIYTFSLANLDFVFCGVFLANICKLLYHSDIGTGKLLKFFSSLATIILIIYNCYIYSESTSIDLFIYQICLPSVYILCCSFLIIVWLPRENSVPVYGRIWGWINGFAKYSYAFYILHVAVLVYVQNLVTNFSLAVDNVIINYIAYFGICFIVTQILAYLMTIGGQRFQKKKGVKTL